MSDPRPCLLVKLIGGSATAAMMIESGNDRNMDRLVAVAADELTERASPTDARGSHRRRTRKT